MRKLVNSVRRFRSVCPRQGTNLNCGMVKRPNPLVDTNLKDLCKQSYDVEMCLGGRPSSIIFTAPFSDVAQGSRGGMLL